MAKTTATWHVLLLCVIAALNSHLVSGNSISTNTTSYEGDEWVEVSWTYTSAHYETDCWVGLFAPVGAPKIHAIEKEAGQSTTPYASLAPIKFINCIQGGKNGTGSHAFYLNNYRQDVFFALFEGGLTTPVEAARSDPLKNEKPRTPMHLRLALTKNANEMQVGWTAKTADAINVQYGKTSTALTDQVVATSVETYGVEDLCGPPANTDGYFEPGFFVNAVIKYTANSGNVYYRVGSDESGWSDVKYFSTSQPKEKVKLLLTADVGATEIDGTHYHWEEPNASSTYRLMSGDIENAYLALHIGDIAYSTGYMSKWENLMHQIEPVSQRIPYMVGLGNHERDYPGTGTIGGTDSGGECGVPAKHRFKMPTPTMDSDNFYFSFNVGSLVHMIMIDTETAEVGPGSEQYDFLKADLSSVNRTETPWVVLMGHRPMYYYDKGWGRNGHFGDAFESLLVQYGVDLCLWGHVHNLLATCNVNNGTCVKPGEGPVHLVIGNGGQSLTEYPGPKSGVPTPSWVTFKLANFGYNEMEITRDELIVNMYSDKDNSLYHSEKLNKKRQ